MRAAERGHHDPEVGLTLLRLAALASVASCGLLAGGALGATSGPEEEPPGLRAGEPFELRIALPELEGPYRDVLGANALTVELASLADRIGPIEAAELELAGHAGENERGGSLFAVSVGRFDDQTQTWMWVGVAEHDPGPGAFRARLPFAPDRRRARESLDSLLRAPRVALNLRLGARITDEGDARARADLSAAGRIERAVLWLRGKAPESTSPGPDGAAPSGARPVFECEYVNFAWGHQHVGFTVDSEGVIRRYDRSGDPWTPAAVRRGDPRLPAADLHAKYVGADIVGRVPSAEVAEKAALLPHAARGSIEREPIAYDAGDAWCVGYVYLPAERVYETVILDGDGTFRNSAREAGVLRDWLQELAPKPEVD